MKLYVEKKVSTKTKNEYTALYINTGSKSIPLTMDTNVLLELTDLRPSELAKLTLGQQLIIGEVVKK